MKKLYPFWIIIFTAIILFSNSAYAQITKVRGVVKDAETNEPVPFVNVTFKNSSIGTITNTDGEYFLESREYYDSIIVSFVGYKKQTHHINKNHFQEINFSLESNVYELDEIVVLPTSC